MMTQKFKKTLRRTFAFALCLAMLLVICPVMHAEASEPTYDVGAYKGEKESAQWTYPTLEGKIFAGWYTDETYSTPYTATTGTAYAKFVDDNLLVVKKQLNSTASYDSDKANIRFLTAIDSLAYSNVTFHVAMPATNKQWTMTEYKAYSSVLVDGAAYPYSAQEVFESSEAAYFVVHTLKGIPQSAFENEIQVSASWQTLDGTVVTNAQSNITVDGEVDYKDGVTTLFKANFEDSTTSDSGKVLDTLTADGWDDYSRKYTNKNDPKNSRLYVVENIGNNASKCMQLTTNGDGAAGAWLEKKINVTGLDNVIIEAQYYMDATVANGDKDWYPHLQLKCVNGNANTANSTTPRVYYRAYEVGALNTWISIKVELTRSETEGKWAVKTYMKDAQGVWVQSTLGEVTEITVTNNELYLCFFAYLRKGVSRDLTEEAGGTLSVPQQSCFVDNIRIYTITE